MRFFGRNRPRTSPEDAVKKMREIVEMLEKREQYLKKKIDQETVVARESLKTNRGVAIEALKRKKQYETDMSKISGTITTMQVQIMTIENANINLEAMNAMKMGSEAIREIHGSINISKVDDTMDDIKEQMDLANEVSNAISQPVGFGPDYDDDELQAELDMLAHLDDAQIPRDISETHSDHEIEELKSSMIL